MRLSGRKVAGTGFEEAEGEFSSILMLFCFFFLFGHDNNSDNQYQFDFSAYPIEIM